MPYKRISIFLAATALHAVILLGQAGLPSPNPEAPAATASSGNGRTNPEDNHGPVEILSDTKGVDLHAYVIEMAHKFAVNWAKRLTAFGWSPYSPKNKKGKVSVDFHVLKDGRIVDVQLAQSSGDTAQDKAAISAVSDSSPLPPLPRDFPCQYVSLRQGFDYSPYHDTREVSHEARELTPCVTTKITFTGHVAVSVSPSSAQVIAGGKLQFLAAVTGETDPTVTWSLRGPGCSVSDCGSVSADGLYTAPRQVPNPATITVTATLRGDPSETGSSTVTIVPPPH